MEAAALMSMAVAGSGNVAWGEYDSHGTGHMSYCIYRVHCCISCWVKTAEESDADGTGIVRKMSAEPQETGTLY